MNATDEPNLANPWHLSRARLKMPQRTPLQRLIAFDRWDRQQQEQA